MILLTGATGFVGSNLLKALLARRYQLCCIKRSSSNCSRVLEFMDACIWYNIDEIDMESIFLNHPIETVIHCATDYGRDEADAVQVYQSNISFPLKLLDCAERHGSQCFINTDSFFVTSLTYTIFIGCFFLDFIGNLNFILIFFQVHGMDHLFQTLGNTKLRPPS